MSLILYTSSYKRTLQKCVYFQCILLPTCSDLKYLKNWKSTPQLSERRAVLYLWSSYVESRVSQFKPLLRFLSGQTSCLLHLLKLLGKLQEERERGEVNLCRAGKHWKLKTPSLICITPTECFFAASFSVLTAASDNFSYMCMSVLQIKFPHTH